MHDLRMGYKQSLLQRLQHIEMSAYTQQTSNDTKSETDTQPAAAAAVAAAAAAAGQVTDFSIQRILGETPEKCKTSQSPQTTSSSSITQDTPPTSPKLYAPVATKAQASADILDLSKNKHADSYSTLNNPAADFSYTTPSSFPYPGIHPNILAAVAAANAQKFYAQFLPHMFPAALYGQVPLQRSTPTVGYPKRYFAPYILNNNSNNNNNNNTLKATSNLKPSQTSVTQQQQPPLTPPTPTSSTSQAVAASHLGQSSTPNKYLCSRLDCVECLGSYYKTPSHSSSGFPYKSPILSPTASTVSSNSSYHSKVPKDVLLSASNISLTSVTSIHVTSAKSTVGSLYDSRSTATSNPEEISYKCRICDKVFGCSQTLQVSSRFGCNSLRVRPTA